MRRGDRGDPGIDGAFALTLALFDPGLEVLGLAATAGNVAAEQATKNIHIVIEQLDPPRWPRVGAALPVVEAAGGIRVAEIQDGERRFPVVVRLADAYRVDPDALGAAVVTAANGDRIALDRLARVARILERRPLRDSVARFERRLKDTIAQASPFYERVHVESLATGD